MFLWLELRIDMLGRTIAELPDLLKRYLYWFLAARSICYGHNLSLFNDFLTSKSVGSNSQQNAFLLLNMCEICIIKGDFSVISWIMLVILF